MSNSPIASGKKVAVLGATGAIGQEVVKIAQQTSSISHVVAIVRRAGSIGSQANVTERVVNFDELSSDAFEGCSIVYCCLGSTIKAAGSQEAFKKQDHDLILRCADKAKEAGVSHFSLVSSVGADSKSNNFYLRTKGEIEDELRSKGFDRVSIWKPSVLEAKRPQFRCGECCGIFLVRWVCGLCICCCCRQYGVIKVEDVAADMVAESLQSPPAGSTTENGTTVYDGSGKMYDVLKQLQPNEKTGLKG